MVSKQKVDELIDIIEKRCHETCLTEKARGIFRFDLGKDNNIDIYLSYHESVGLTMYYGEIWYTDEKRIDRLTKVPIPNMREKITKLIMETDYVTIKDLERIAFELS